MLFQVYRFTELEVFRTRAVPFTAHEHPSPTWLSFLPQPFVQTEVTTSLHSMPKESVPVMRTHNSFR